MDVAVGVGVGGAEVGVTVGGTGVKVGGTGVDVGGIGVAVGELEFTATCPFCVVAAIGLAAWSARMTLEKVTAEVPAALPRNVMVATVPVPETLDSPIPWL